MTDKLSLPPHSKECLAIIDRVCERDRLFFEEHPNLSSYSRPYVHGEIHQDIHPLLDHPNDIPFIRVIKVRPGFRIRQPLFTTWQVLS